MTVGAGGVIYNIHDRIPCCNSLCDYCTTITTKSYGCSEIQVQLRNAIRRQALKTNFQLDCKCGITESMWKISPFIMLYRTSSRKIKNKYFESLQHVFVGLSIAMTSSTDATVSSQTHSLPRCGVSLLKHIAYHVVPPHCSNISIQISSSSWISNSCEVLL